MLAKCIAEVLTSELADTFRQAYAPNLQSCLQMQVLSIAKFFKIKKDGLFPSFDSLTSGGKLCRWQILQNQKRFFRFFLFGLELTRFNHGKGVYIIKTKFCISPRRKPCISSLRKKIQPTADDIHLR